MIRIHNPFPTFVIAFCDTLVERIQGANRRAVPVSDVGWHDTCWLTIIRQRRADLLDIWDYSMKHVTAVPGHLSRPQSARFAIRPQSEADLFQAIGIHPTRPTRTRAL